MLIDFNAKFLQSSCGFSVGEVSRDTESSNPAPAGSRSETRCLRFVAAKEVAPASISAQGEFLGLTLKGGGLKKLGIPSRFPRPGLEALAARTCRRILLVQETVQPDHQVDFSTPSRPAVMRARSFSERCSRSNVINESSLMVAPTEDAASYPGRRHIPHLIALAAASISSARARTRMSLVKFTHRIVPDGSRRNSAGREMSCFSGPPATCSRSYDIKNLWPQPTGPPLPGAFDKDGLENELHHLVSCPANKFSLLDHFGRVCT